MQPLPYQDPRQVADSEAALRAVLPIGRSGLAIAAGYAGMFAVIPILAPLAILFGVLALRDIKRNPDKLGKGRAIFGLVMGILGTILLPFALPTIIDIFTGKW